VYIMSDWINTVKRVFKQNRATNKNYKFKQALLDAKKIYRSTTSTVDTMGPALASNLAKKVKRGMKKSRKLRKSRRNRRGGNGNGDTSTPVSNQNQNNQNGDGDKKQNGDGDDVVA
jgi:hypothetical protein